MGLGEPGSWSFPQEAEEQEEPWSTLQEEHSAWSPPRDSEEQEALGPWPHEDSQEEEPGSWALPQDNEELLTAAVQDCLEREQVDTWAGE